MDYIDNIALTILIILLRDGALNFYSPDIQSTEDLAWYISILKSLFLNKHENISIEEEENFNENNAPTIEFKKHSNSVNIHCNNIERLRTFLREYSENYKNGTLIEHGDVNEYDAISALHDMLIAKAIGKTTNNARYIETDIKYAPLILLKYFENNDFIQRVTIQLAPKKEMPYPMILFERGLDGLPEEYTSNWHEYFNCRYVLNMDWYIEDYYKSISKTITKERRDKFSPVQQRVYNYILKKAKEGIFVHSRIDLKNCMKLTTKDRTLNELRAQYIEIYHKEPNFNIITYNRSTEYYEVHEDILKDK